MKLCFSPAYCSLAVHIALSESGQPFQLARVEARPAVSDALRAEGLVRG